MLPAHFNAPARATPRDLQQAFAFAYQLVGATPGPVAKKAGGGAGAGAPSNPLAALFAGLQQGAGAGAGAGGAGKVVEYPEDDMAVLRFVNDFIKKSGVASR